MEFLEGMFIGLISGYLNLVGIPLNSLVGTLFILLMFPTPVALGYWTVSQALVLTQVIGELFYVVDKELDDNSPIEMAKQAGDLKYIANYVIRTEGLFIFIKAAIIFFVINDPNFFGSNPVISAIIKISTFIMVLFIMRCMWVRYKYESLEVLIKYLVGALSIILLFIFMQKANIGTFNSIPLLLSVVFLDLPSLYGNKEEILHPQLEPKSFSWEYFQRDYGYLLIVFICNIGIGTSKLTNYMLPEEGSESNIALNLCLGKSVSSFVSSVLWILFASTRSALEDSVSYIELTEIKNYGAAIIIVMLLTHVTCLLNKKWLIEQAEKPLKNLTKTWVNSIILLLMLTFSLHGQLNLFILILLFIIGVLINVFVNQAKIPNSALSFITTYVPVSGMLF